MKKIIVSFVLFVVVMVNCFSIPFVPSLQKMTTSRTEENTQKIKKRVYELKDSNPKKLKKELLQKDSNGRTPFFYAVWENDENLFNSMIEIVGSDIRDIINTLDNEGHSLLSEAIVHKASYQIIKKLVDFGSDCNIKVNYDFPQLKLKNCSILFCSVLFQNNNVINSLLPTVYVIDDTCKYTYLYEEEEITLELAPLAMMLILAEDSTQYNDCIKLFLEKGADPNKTIISTFGDYCTPMHLAASYNNRDVYNLLKAHNGDSKKLGIFEGESVTPFELISRYCENDADRLFFAYDEEENVEKIISSIIKTNINIKSTGDKKTPIQIAMSRGDVRTAIELMEKESDVYYKDSSNKTVLDYALQQNADEFIEAYLAKKRSAKDSIFNVIDYVLKNDRIDYVRRFLEIDSTKYQFTDRPTGSKHNCLTYTAYINSDSSYPETRIKLVDLLLQKGYKINETVVGGDDSGNTALIYAAKNNNKELFDYLLQKGADVNSSNTGKYNGRTAVFYALESGSKDIFEELMQRPEVQKTVDIKLANKADNSATFLMFLSRFGTKEQMKTYLPLILEKDKNALKRTDSELYTPFLYAAAYNPDYEVMKILRMYGADVNAKAGPLNAVILAEIFNSNRDTIIEKLNNYGVYENEAD